VVGDWDAFWSRAEEAMASIKALAGQLGSEQGAHLLAKGTLAEALKVAETSRTEAVVWKGKVEGESCSPCFICFSYARPLTPRCDAELEKEASRATEASRVEVQGWKEKAKASRVEAQRWEEKAEGESRRPSPLFGLFSFALNPIPFVLAQSERKRSPRQPRPLSQCKWCLRSRSGSTMR